MMAFEINDKVLTVYKDEGAETAAIPEGVETIGEYAFTGAENLVNVVLPEGILKIEQYAFWNCRRLKSIVFPHSLKAVARFAFWGCDSLEEVRFYENLNSLGNAVFRDCDMLKTAQLPENMDDIGSSAFSNCVSLENMVIPKGIKIIKQRTFYGCLALKNISLPDGLEAVDEYAFECCRLLDGIELPESTVSIGRHAFDTCRALKNINIPKSVKKIGSSAFINTALINTSESDFVTEGDGILIQYVGSDTEVNVPEGVKTIGERAFSFKKDITRINLPDSAEKIDEYAFESCEALKAVVLPEHVFVLGAHAFSGCKSLESIKLSQSLVNIGADVFFDTPLLNNTGGDMLILEDRFLVAYKGSGSCPVIPDTVRYICGGAFAKCSFISKIDIPEGVVSIGASAFEWCSGLESVSIPESVIHIGENAFAHIGAASVKIKYGGGKTIGAAAFYRNTKIDFLSGENVFSLRLKKDFVSDAEEELLNKFAADNNAGIFETMSENAYKLPIALTFINKAQIYKTYIKQNMQGALSYIIDNNAAELMDKLFESDIVSENDISAAVDMAIERGNTEMQTAFLRYKHEKWGDSAEEHIDKKFIL